MDGDRRRKPLWYALRSLNAPRLLMIKPRGDSLALIASNDTPETWTETVQLQRRNLDGTVIATQEVLLEVAPRDNQTVLLDSCVIETINPPAELLVATSCAAQRAYRYFSEDVELALPPLDIDIEVHRTETATPSL